MPATRPRSTAGLSLLLLAALSLPAADVASQVGYGVPSIRSTPPDTAGGGRPSSLGTPSPRPTSGASAFPPAGADSLAGEAPSPPISPPPPFAAPESEVGPPAPLGPPEEVHLIGPSAPVGAVEDDADGRGRFGLWRWVADGGDRPLHPHLGGRRIEGFMGGAIPNGCLLKVKSGRVVREVDLDLEEKTVQRTVRFEELAVVEPLPEPLGDHIRRAIFASRWESYARESRTLLGREVTPGGRFLGEGGGFTLAAPGGVLGPAEAVLGKGASITIRGSEQISISGTSRWDAGLKENDNIKQSKFPQLDLRQNLNINVDGKVGDKVSIDWMENSNQETPLANRIAIRYAGYEEEVVKAVELGNTNLSLPGTQFVSYNGQHQGLFGIKTQSQFGSLGLTVIASKQQGQTASNRFVGHAQETRRQIYDLDYVQRRFFFLVDPVDPLLTGTLLPPESPDWLPPPTISNLQLWRDDRDQQNNGAAVPGFAFVGYRFTSAAPDTAVSGQFDHLEEQVDYTIRSTDFFILRDDQGNVFHYPVIDLKSPIGRDEILAATFTARFFDGQEVTYGALESTLGGDTLRAKALYLNDVFYTRDDDDLVSRSDFRYPVRRLELRNVYSLGSTAIDMATLKLGVKRLAVSGSDQDHFPDDPSGAATYLRGLGVDKEDLQGAVAPDGNIDRKFLKPDEGLVLLPDLRPFAPAAEDSVWPFFRADLPLAGPPGRPAFFVGDHGNRAVYDDPAVQRNVDGKYFFEVSYATPQTELVLSAPGTILEGSETVVVNGETLARGSGYTIDYETGVVKLTRKDPLPPNAPISIDYAFAPLFALGQKTLMGFHAGWDPGTGATGRRFGTTWLFESAGVAERRPKLGEEPSRTMVGDLNGGFQTKPFVMNQLVEALPGVRASADSRFDVSAEMGLSLPNPNTKGQVYIDDFEGVKENSILSMQRDDWFWSSIPEPVRRESTALDFENRRGQLLWYNPVVSPVIEKDLFPQLETQEGNDRRLVLTLHLDPRRADSLGAEPKTWMGLTQGISGNGADFTRKQFIEVWINDFGDRLFRADHPRMIVDLGTIDEDAQWHPTEPPNERLDSEDRNTDGVLDRSETVYEDTGFDYLRSSDEPGFGPGNLDPHGDDFAPEFKRDVAEDHPVEPFPYFEGVNLLEENQHLDSEDWNRDTFLLTANDYFEYTVDLADGSLYEATNVCEDFGRCGPQEKDPEQRPNGWRLFRIPIDAGRRVGSPSLGAVRQLRIWFTGLTGPQLLQIAEINIQGNLFKIEPLRDATGTAISNAAGEVVTIRGINNKENANEYVPPIKLLEREGVVEREQSLAVDFLALGPGHEGAAFRGLPSDRDFTLYETLKWWVYGGGVEDGVEAFVRFGADTLNYYEFALPVRPGWSEETIPLAELSGLKLEATAADSCSVGGTRLPCLSRRRADGRLLRFVGRPSFTRMRRVTFGVRNTGPDPASGSVWFDELRLDDVFRDRGTATRLEIQTAFADLLTITTNLLTRDEDFLSIGSGGQRTVGRGIGSRQRDLGLRSTMNLHKFFETSGVNLPVAFNFSRNTELPEFQAGNDVVLTGEESRSQERGSTQRSYSANFSRQGAPAGLLKYSLDAFRADFSLADRRSLSQTRTDSSRTIGVGLHYNLAPGLKPVKLGKSELRYFPDNIALGLQASSSRAFSFNRDLEDLTRQDLISATYQKNASLNGSTSLAILKSLRAGYQITSDRDLIAENPARWLGGLNIGAETSRRQGLDLNWTPPVLPQVTPNLTFRGGSNDVHTPNLRLASDREQVRNLSGSQTLTGGFNVPITLLTGRGPSVPAPGDTAAGFRRRFQNQLGRVGRLRDVRVALSANNSRDFGYATGVPGWLYQLGLSTDPGPDIELTDRGQERRAEARQASLGSGFDFQTGIVVTTGYAWGRDKQESTSNVPLDSRKVTWPQVDLEWRTFHSRIPGLAKAFRSLSLESKYTRDRSESGPRPNPSQSITERRRWEPLVGVTGNLLSGWNMRANVNSTGSKSLNNGAGLGGFDNTTQRRFQVNMTRRFDSRTGIKFPWQKEPIKLKSDLTFNADLTYAIDRAESGRRGQPTVVSRDGTTSSIRSSVSSRFRKNIDGEFSINFGRTNNNKTGQKLRTIGLSGSISFNF